MYPNVPAVEVPQTANMNSERAASGNTQYQIYDNQFVSFHIMYMYECVCVCFAGIASVLYCSYVPLTFWLFVWLKKKKIKIINIEGKKELAKQQLDISIYVYTNLFHKIWNFPAKCRINFICVYNIVVVVVLYACVFEEPQCDKRNLVKSRRFHLKTAHSPTLYRHPWSYQ